MKTYELLYIIDAKIADDAKEAIVDKFKSMVEKNGGKVIAIDKWGIKKYAYPINFANEGFYVLMTFEAKPEVPNLIGAQLVIAENVVRHMCTEKIK